jgi:hypothetical protein
MALRTLSGRTGWSRKNSPVHAIADRIPFRTYGSLSGRFVSNQWDYGILPREFVDTFREDVSNHGPVFVVYSYATPIAWITDDGRTECPDTRYSVTTSKSQGTARLALSVFSGETPRPTEWDA